MTYFNENLIYYFRVTCLTLYNFLNGVFNALFVNSFATTLEDIAIYLGGILPEGDFFTWIISGVENLAKYLFGTLIGNQPLFLFIFTDLVIICAIVHFIRLFTV